MNPQWIFGIAGLVAIAWGAIVAVGNQWATRLGKKMQGIYGRRASDQVTPARTRLIGILLVVGGVAFVLLAVFRVFPDHS